MLGERETIKGEITLVVSPPEPVTHDAAAIDAALIAAARDLPKAKAAARVAHELGLPRKDLYARLLALDAE